MATLSVRSLSGIPEVRAGDDLAALIAGALAAQWPPRPLRGGEIVAIAHKVVSKAEGAVVALAEVEPSTRALELAAGPHALPVSAAEAPSTTSGGTLAAQFPAGHPAQLQKDPRAVQVVLDQSREVLRAERGVLICRTHQGFVCANAGVDASNAADGTVVVLPADPDASARHLRTRLRELTRAQVAVLISDSFGRAWRHGQCDVAIGCAGLTPLDDWRGHSDNAGRELHATWLAVADAIAATADLARSKDSREPVVILDGLERFLTANDGPGALALLRAAEEDLFR